MTEDARLIYIGVDPDDPWAFTGGEEIPPPGIKILSETIPPGEYGLRYSLVTEPGKAEISVQFSLHDGMSDKPVGEPFVIPALPYFSGHAVAHKASGIFGGGETERADLVKLFPNETGKSGLDLANDFMGAQCDAFENWIGQWLDLSEQDNLRTIANVQFKISSVLSMILSTLGNNYELVQLPKGWDNE